MDMPPEVSTGSQQLVAIITVVLSTIGGWVTIVLRRKRPRDGASDAVFEANTATIVDLRRENVALRGENDELRRLRSEFEGQLITANANLKIAQQAAATAAAAAENNLREYEALQQRYVKARRHIHDLRTKLADHGLEIPPEPI